MRLRILLPAVFVMIMAAVSGYAATTQNIVNSFFPAALTTDEDGAVAAARRHSAFVVGDLNHDHSLLIVAVYWNESQGAVSVLSPAGDGAVLATILPGDMRGSRGTVALMDLEHTDRPDIVVTMAQPRGPTPAWVFKWTGSALQFAGPADPQGADAYSTDLADPVFLDLDGSGVLSVVDHHSARVPCSSPCDEEQIAEERRLFQWVNGELKRSGTVDCLKQYTRGTGDPTAKNDTIAFADSSTPRQLIVVNGQRDGSGRASSATISVNGQVVVDQRTFNQNVASIRVPVTVTPNTLLSVTLAGKPGANISLLLMTPP